MKTVMILLQLLNSSIPKKVFLLGVPAKPSGFPLYLCSLNWERGRGTGSGSKDGIKTRSRSRITFPFSLAKDAASIPNAEGLLSNELRALSKKNSLLIAQGSQIVFNFQLKNVAFPWL